MIKVTAPDKKDLELLDYNKQRISKKSIQEATSKTRMTLPKLARRGGNEQSELLKIEEEKIEAWPLS